MATGFFVVKRFHYKKIVVHYKTVKNDLPETDIIMIGETVPVKGFKYENSCM